MFKSSRRCLLRDTGLSFLLLETNFHDVMCWRILPAQFWLCVPYRWRGGRPDRSRRTWRRCTFGCDSQAAASFVLCVCVCVCVCVSLLPSANLRGMRVHIVRRHTDELHASDQKHNEGKKKRDSPPVKGTTTWNTGAAKGPWNQNTKHKKTKKQKSPDMSESLSLVRVSHGITQFWSHPVGHFEGIFFSPQSQSNLNNFQLHILTLNPSLMSYLCDYVSLLAKKKKKKQAICTNCQPLVALSSFFFFFFFFFFPADGRDFF